MSDRQELELDRQSYREIHKGPLAKPRDLWFGAILWSAASIVCATMAWQIHEWWTPFLAIPCAMWAGVGFAGLFPGWFFGKGD